MLIGGVDIRGWGFRPQGRTWPKVGANVALQPVQGRPGGVWTGAATPPGNLLVTGLVLGTDRADAMAKARQIIALCRPGSQHAVSLIFSDDADREWHGHLDPASARQDLGKQWIGRMISLSLAFTLPDPRATSVLTTQVEVAANEIHTLDLGTAPSELHVRVPDPDGEVIVEMMSGHTVLDKFTWAPGDLQGDLRIDSALMTVTQGWNNAVATVAPDAVFPVADAGRGATNIRVNRDAVVIYRKRWWS